MLVDNIGIKAALEKWDTTITYFTLQASPCSTFSYVFDNLCFYILHRFYIVLNIYLTISHAFSKLSRQPRDTSPA
jgi:hypothetical protein